MPQKFRGFHFSELVLLQQKADEFVKIKQDLE